MRVALYILLGALLARITTSAARRGTSSRHGPGMGRADWDRLTDRARSVIGLSREQADDLEHDYIGTEHLLLALTRCDGVAGAVLRDLGVDPDAARERVLAHLSVEPDPT